MPTKQSHIGANKQVYTWCRDTKQYEVVTHYVVSQVDSL